MTNKFHDVILAAFDRACPQERNQPSWQDDNFVVQQTLAYLRFQFRIQPDEGWGALPLADELQGYFCTELTDSLEVRRFLRSLCFRWNGPYPEEQYRKEATPPDLSCGMLRIRLERSGEEDVYLTFHPELQDYAGTDEAVLPDTTDTVLFEDMRMYSRDAADFCRNLERVATHQLLRMFCIQQNMNPRILLPNALGELDAFLLHPEDPEALIRLNLIRPAGFLLGGARVTFLASDREGHPVLPPPYMPNPPEVRTLSCHAVLPTTPSEDGLRITEAVPFPVRPIPLAEIRSIHPGGERSAFLETVVKEGIRYAGHLILKAASNGN